MAFSLTAYEKVNPSNGQRKPGSTHFTLWRSLEKTAALANTLVGCSLRDPEPEDLGKPFLVF